MKKNTFIPLNDQASKALKGGKTTIEVIDAPSMKGSKRSKSKSTIEVIDAPSVSFSLNNH
ncbi:MAG: hypothetical protein DBW80_03640 [Bacteroidetes bacterium]|nr:MAG: hypothetical protein DBW80_03640 [Bacteroidota bacterium]